MTTGLDTAFAALSDATRRAVLEEIRFFFSSRRRHTRSKRDWSSDVCSSDLLSEKLKGSAPELNRDFGLAFRHPLAGADIEGNIRPPPVIDHEFQSGVGFGRSEERRVGKECSSRWWAYQLRSNGSFTVERPHT